MNDVYPNNKAEFINWFLNHHNIASAAAEWLLKKIVNHEVMERTFFVNDVTNKKCSVIITTCDYDKTDGEEFICSIDGEKIPHRAFVVYILKNKMDELYIQFNFKSKSTKKYLEEVMGIEKENLFSVITDIFLKYSIVKQELEELHAQIDVVLDAKDKKAFKKIVKRIEELKEKYPLL